MKKPWFKEWKWIYLPVSFLGWILLFLTLFFCAQVFVVVDRHSHSVSDTIYGIFPYVVPAFGILGWIALKTSKRSDEKD